MNHLKEKSNLSIAPHSTTPYSRPNTSRFFKIPKRPSTFSSTCGKTFIPENPTAINYPNRYDYTQNHQNLFSFDDFNDSIRLNENCPPSTSRYTENNRQREFYPRGSHQENRTSIPFQQLGTMSIGNGSDVTDSSKKAKFTKTTEETSTRDSFQIKLRENSLRIFSGSVANLFHWFKLKEKFHMLFEVTGILENVQPGKWSTEKILHLTDSKTGPRMQVVYYEIDRALPSLSGFSVIKCVGRLLARNRLHAFKVEESSEEEKNAGQRLSFICNRVAEELTMLQQKK